MMVLFLRMSAIVWPDTERTLLPARQKEYGLVTQARVGSSPALRNMTRCSACWGTATVAGSLGPGIRSVFTFPTRENKMVNMADGSVASS